MKTADEMRKLVEYRKAARAEVIQQKCEEFVEQVIAPMIEDKANDGCSLLMIDYGELAPNSTVINKILSTYGYTASGTGKVWQINW